MSLCFLINESFQFADVEASLIPLAARGDSIVFLNSAIDSLLLQTNCLKQLCAFDLYAHSKSPPLQLASLTEKVTPLTTHELLDLLDAHDSVISWN